MGCGWCRIALCGVMGRNILDGFVDSTIYVSLDFHCFGNARGGKPPCLCVIGRGGGKRKGRMINAMFYNVVTKRLNIDVEVVLKHLLVCRREWC